MIDFFPEKPWPCKCGCGFRDINPQLVKRLNVARYLAGRPFVVTSACRCSLYNAQVGGAANSFHIAGLAADVACKDSTDRFRIVQAAIAAGFQRIGIARNFIHLDIGDTGRTNPIIFLYKERLK